MRLIYASVALLCLAGFSRSQEANKAAQGTTNPIAERVSEEPSSEKAQKSFRQGLEDLHERRYEAALDSFKKADKQDGGHCGACQKNMIKYGVELGEWKTAEQAAQEMVDEAQDERGKAKAHYEFAVVLLNEGLQRHKEEEFLRAHEEAAKALASYANFPDAVFADGRALSYLKRDEEAKARFEQYVKMNPQNEADRQRAVRFISQPELARARMAPPFVVTTLDGKRISMDELQGQVVLMDFWATWCEPCREAMPHIRNVAKKFQGQPLVILSVSLDSDEQKWKEYVAKNEMTWPQYNDGGFKGQLARTFGVVSIPHTFTIDAEGVLQEEHVGDASIEGKLKKLLARAKELQTGNQTPAK